MCDLVDSCRNSHVPTVWVFSHEQTNSHAFKCGPGAGMTPSHPLIDTTVDRSCFAIVRWYPCAIPPRQHDNTRDSRHAACVHACTSRTKLFIHPSPDRSLSRISGGFRRARPADFQNITCQRCERPAMAAPAINPRPPFSGATRHTHMTSCVCARGPPCLERHRTHAAAHLPFRVQT